MACPRISWSGDAQSLLSPQACLGVVILSATAESVLLSFRPKPPFLLSQESTYVPHCHFERRPRAFVRKHGGAVEKSGTELKQSHICHSTQATNPACCHSYRNEVKRRISKNNHSSIILNHLFSLPESLHVLNTSLRIYAYTHLLILKIFHKKVIFLLNIQAKFGTIQIALKMAV